MEFSYIYALLDEYDNIRYIGKSRNPYKRLKTHLCKSNLKLKTHKNHWIKSLLKQNKMPKIKIIAKCNIKNINSKEKYYITFYKNKGYNLTNGTPGGDGWPEGVPITGNAKKGNKKPQFKRKIKAINRYNHDEVLYFNGIKDASEELNLHKVNISEALSKKIKSIGGYFWFYEEENIKIPKYKKTKIVMGYCIKTEKIYLYYSTWDVDSNKFDRSTVCKACKGLAYGFDGHFYKNIRWEYI